ncbi:unnamed protein product [marine sediment metagenome]|uniref:Uncharacterized protein n=1 Tax=marine sediment metagenome TaxID=412755 RepID=X1P3G3_9ZZZZ
MAKEKSKWKPKKKWITVVEINPKTGERKYTYQLPKSAEEEKQWEEAYNQKMLETVEEVLSRADEKENIKKEKGRNKNIKN